MSPHISLKINKFIELGTLRPLGRWTLVHVGRVPFSRLASLCHDKIARYPSWNVSVIFAWTKSRLKWPFQLIILPPCHNPVSSLPQRIPPYYCSSITAVISIFGISLHFLWCTFCILYFKQINQTVIFLSFPRYCHHSKENGCGPKMRFCTYFWAKNPNDHFLYYSHTCYVPRVIFNSRIFF